MDRTRRNLRSSNRGRGRATPATRGRGRTIPIGRGRGSETLTDHEDIVDPGTTPDPIVEVVANSVPPTAPIDPTAAYQAIQTLVGLFTGQQAQTGNSMTFDKGTVLDRFLKTTPPSFIGSDKPSDAEAWLLRMEKIFDILGCSETQKVSLATYKLEGDAEHWWRMAKQKYKGKENELVWSAFKKDFEDKYIPPAVKNQKRIEFLNLEQGSLTVAEYQRKFDELSRYAGKQVEKEEDKMWYFLKGLRSDIHGRVSLLDVKTLAELVTKALTAENDIKEENISKEHQFKRTREWWQPGQNNEGGNSNKKTFNGGNQGQRFCDRCGKSHYGYSCDGTPKLCYSCGQPGHIASRCKGKGKDVDPSQGQGVSHFIISTRRIMF